MNINEILNDPNIMTTITAWLSMWAPAITATVSVVVIVIKGLKQLRDAVTAFKKDQALIELNNKLSAYMSENEQMRRELNIITEQLTHVKDYAKK